MTGSSTSVIVLGHGAERTGPPIYLLRLLRWIRGHTDIDVEVILLTGGPLLHDLRRLANVAVLDEGERLAPRDSDAAPVVYVNTAGSIAALAAVPARTGRVVTHVHELSTGLDFHLPADRREVLLEATDRFLAVAEVVADELARDYGVDRSRIAIHRGFLDPDPPPVPVGRRELGLPLDRPLVMAAGTIDWRKGPDLWLQVAQLVAEATDGSVHFVWVGGDLESPVAESMADNVRRAGLGDIVRFVGEQAEPDLWFAHAEVFVLPSREDAFPLVGLEAARHDVPIVCFDAGGMPELVRDDAGVVVPFPDCEAMADAITALVRDPIRRERLGAVAGARVRQDHIADAAVPLLLDELLGDGWREHRS